MTLSKITFIKAHIVLEISKIVDEVGLKGE